MICATELLCLWWFTEKLGKPFTCIWLGGQGSRDFNIHSVWLRIGYISICWTNAKFQGLYSLADCPDTSPLNSWHPHSLHWRSEATTNPFSLHRHLALLASMKQDPGEKHSEIFESSQSHFYQSTEWPCFAFKNFSTIGILNRYWSMRF